MEADLPSCSLSAENLSTGWELGSVASYDFYDRVLPGRALGGIRLIFTLRAPGVEKKALQGILLHRSSRAASSQFKRMTPSNSARFYHPMVETELPQANLAADDFQVECAYFKGPAARTKSCHFRARYDRLLSVVTSDVSLRQDGMDDMVHLLQAIDKRMIQCVELYKDQD